ncbi:MAG: phage portal protein, partial [Bacillaceae bacterium G1]
LPNPEITSFSFRETAMAHLCLWGNAYAEIENDGAGRIRALWPLPPWRVQVERDPATQRLKYIVTLDNGERQALDVSRVFHVPALSFNGLVGISPIRWAAREAIGLALATEQFGARFFDQGTNIGGVVTHPKTLSEQASRNLRESINETYAGLGKSHRIMLLEEGMKYERIGIPPEEAQFLETRKFQVTEIARIFRVPPHMLADLERATFSNIEHQSIEFVTHTIRPWLVRWEQAIYRDLLFPDERKEYFVEFNVDGLLRGDIESRYRAYAIGRQWGWLSANDIREMENKNPIPGGDVYWAPVNMIPAEMMAAQNVEPEDAPPERATREARAIRAAKGRQRTASTFRPVFEDAARRIIRREEADVMRSARKMIGQRDTNSFLAWLEDFYREHKEFILAVLAAPLRSLAEAIQAEAAEEIGAPVGLTPSLEEFLNAYLEGYADRHFGSSLGKYRSGWLEAVQAGEDPGEKLKKR